MGLGISDEGASMVRPFRLALLAGAAALGVVSLSAPPAAAQVLSPWNVWSDPRVFGPDDDFVEDNFLPPQAIRRIVAAQGYRLAAAPRLAGDKVVAIGRNARGERVRFVIDGYSGQLLRRTALVDRQAPDLLEPGAPRHKAKPKSKHKPHPQTATRKPTTEAPEGRDARALAGDKGAGAARAHGCGACDGFGQDRTGNGRTNQDRAGQR